MIFTQLQFLFGTDHAVRLDTAHFRFADLHAAGQFGPHRRQRYQLPGGDVGRAADDLQRRLFTHLHAAEHEVIRIGQRLAGQHPAGHHACQRAGKGFDLLGFQAQHGEIVHQLLGGHIEVDQALQPVERYFHRTSLELGE